MRKLSPSKILVHVPHSSLDLVLIGSDSPLHSQILLSPLQFSVHKGRVVISPGLFILFLLTSTVLLDTLGSLVISPGRVSHHLSELGLLLLVGHPMLGGRRATIFSLHLSHWGRDWSLFPVVSPISLRRGGL